MSGALAILALGVVLAQEPDPELEFHRGVVLGSARVLGMGGACIAVAEGARSQLMNPAAIARRKQGGWVRRLDGDADLATVNLPWSERPRSPSNLDESQPQWLLTTNANARYNRVGVGVGLLSHAYSFEAGALRLRQNELSVGAALTSRDASWTVGVLGVWEDTAVVRTGPGGGPVLSASGPGFVLGGLWSPADRNTRLGAQVMLGEQAPNVVQRSEDPAEGYALSGVHSPWQVGLGGAVRFGGPSPWNARPRFGDTSSWVLPFVPSVLLAGDLVLIGPSAGAVSPGAWLEGRRDSAALSWTARTGAEATVWDGRLRARTGFYWEPGRFTDTPGRLHTTFGADVRVRVKIRSRVTLPLDFRLTPAVDLAPGYVRTGFGVGVW